jgi:LacI family xylobiose transport system transcriptional regulator
MVTNGKTSAAPSSDRSTLSRIARDAEVSTSTVSKVLNGRAGVSELTRARVEALLHEHGYQRRGGREAAPLIELVFTALDAPWALEIIRGVETEARSRGLGVVLSQSGDRHGPGQDWMDTVLRRDPAGIVLVLSDLRDSLKRQLQSRGIPFVLLDPAGDPASDVPAVGAANWNGALIATRHLLSLGHSAIGLIGGPADMLCSRARVAGYRSALDEAGVPVREDLIVSGEFDRDDGLRLGRQMLARSDRPTAIFAGNDLMALGVYEAARLAGLTIPGDLSVVGYDDLPAAGWAGPPLTTVRQPLSEMGREATRMILDLHRAGAVRAPRVDLATDLVVRASTAPPA